MSIALTDAPLPTLFLSHGSPMIAVDPREAGHFMQSLGPRIDAQHGRPRAIVVMSPHTATRTPFVLGAESHEAIHDFGGFPESLYALRYDAPGDPALSKRVLNLLKQSGIGTTWTEQGGLDHGIWTTLMHLYPQANVPVVPVSLTPHASPAQVFAMGKALGGGSGWVLLMWSYRDGRLINQWAADHTHTLAEARPILALDMYEHAYHIDFGARAASRR